MSTDLYQIIDGANKIKLTNIITSISVSLSEIDIHLVSVNLTNLFSFEHCLTILINYKKTMFILTKTSIQFVNATAKATLQYTSPFHKYMFAFGE